nr:immunoglobulin light chain junction region [Macaca mulatta]
DYYCLVYDDSDVLF